MRQGDDIQVLFKGLVLIHQKIRGREVTAHAHESEHEIFLPLQGEIQVVLDTGDELKAGPGKMIYIPPGLPHTFLASKSGEGERLIAIVESKTWSKHGGLEHRATVLSVSQLCKELLFYLLLHPGTKAGATLTATLIETWSEMLEITGRSGTGDLAHLGGQAKDPRLKNALTQLAKQSFETLSMEALARDNGLSTRSLNRLFLTELGLTPKQVVTLHRIERAKQLLMAKRTTVTDVALEVGYSSVSQFITTFRKVTGQLPSELLRA